MSSLPLLLFCHCFTRTQHFSLCIDFNKWIYIDSVCPAKLYMAIEWIGKVLHFFHSHPLFSLIVQAGMFSQFHIGLGRMNWLVILQLFQYPLFHESFSYPLSPHFSPFCLTLFLFLSTCLVLFGVSILLMYFSVIYSPSSPDHQPKKTLCVNMHANWLLYKIGFLFCGNYPFCMRTAAAVMVESIQSHRFEIHFQIKTYARTHSKTPSRKKKWNELNEKEKNVPFNDVYCWSLKITNILGSISFCQSTQRP